MYLPERYRAGNIDIEGPPWYRRAPFGIGGIEFKGIEPERGPFVRLRRICRMDFSFHESKGPSSGRGLDALGGDLAGGLRAQDFVLRLLAPKKKRIGCEEALNHPFLSE